MAWSPLLGDLLAGMNPGTVVQADASAHGSPRHTFDEDLLSAEHGEAWVFEENGDDVGSVFKGSQLSFSHEILFEHLLHAKPCAWHGPGDRIMADRVCLGGPYNLVQKDRLGIN